MYKYILQSVNGIEWFAIAALLIFFGTFLFALVRTALDSKEDAARMAQLPLDEN